MLLPLQRYAEFDGRSGRSEYWLFVLFQVLVTVACIIVFLVLSTLTMDGNGDPSGFGTVLLIGFVLLYLGLFLIPGIAVSIRRWHDLDQSGWFFLLFAVLGAIPLVGFLASIANLIWFCMPGTDGENQYGPDPRGDGGSGPTRPTAWTS